MIQVEGAEVGQFNALSVVELGEIAFGQPSRITASVVLGLEGLIDIEREARLGGPIDISPVGGAYCVANPRWETCVASVLAYCPQLKRGLAASK